MRGLSRIKSQDILGMERWLDGNQSVIHFAQANLCDMVVEAIEHRQREKVWEIFSFAIMPSHIHFSLNSMTHFRSSKNSRSLNVGLDIKLPRSILVYQRSGFGKRNGSITGREVTKKTKRLSDTFKTIQSKHASPDSMASTDTAREPGSLLPTD